MVVAASRCGMHLWQGFTHQACSNMGESPMHSGGKLPWPQAYSQIHIYLLNIILIATSQNSRGKTCHSHIFSWWCSVWVCLYSSCPADDERHMNYRCLVLLPVTRVSCLYGCGHENPTALSCKKTSQKTQLNMQKRSQSLVAHHSSVSSKLYTVYIYIFFFLLKTF